MDPESFRSLLSDNSHSHPAGGDVDPSHHHEGSDVEPSETWPDQSSPRVAMSVSPVSTELFADYSSDEERFQKLQEKRKRKGKGHKKTKSVSKTKTKSTKKHSDKRSNIEARTPLGGPNASFQRDISVPLLLDSEPEGHHVTLMDDTIDDVFGHDDIANSYSSLYRFGESPSLHDRIVTRHVRMWGILLSILFFLILYFVPIFDKEDRTSQKAMALVVFASILYIWEAVPFWVTSLSVPVVLILSRIEFKYTDTFSMSAPASASVALSAMITSTMFTMLGAQSLAAGLHKYGLDHRLLSGILGLSHGTSKMFLLLLMIMGVLFSLCLSNIAAPVMLLAFVSPLYSKIQDTSLHKCIALAIAMSCNIGGMVSPAASIPSIIASQTIALYDISEHDVSFVTWTSLFFPVALILVLLCWLWLLLVFRPPKDLLLPLEYDLAHPASYTGGSDDSKLSFSLPNYKVEVSWKHWYVGFVWIATLALWTLFHYEKGFFDNLGFIGLFPVIMLFGTDVLDIKDMDRIDWNALALIGGSSALQVVMEYTRLSRLISDHLDDILPSSDLETFLIVCGGVMLLSNVLTQPVTSMISLPIAIRVGVSRDLAVRFALGAAASSVVASCLPVSSFSNAVVYSKSSNTLKQRLLSSSDFLATGLILQLSYIGLLASLGWFLFDQSDIE